MLREETLELAKRYGISLAPEWDEQQLVNPEVIELLIDTANVGEADTILEIGAGCGNITMALAQKAGKVVAVEKNGKFIQLLRDRTSKLENATIIEGDALTMRLPKFTKIVSNLPYSICEAMTHRLIWHSFSKAALVVSSSYADKVTANEEDEGYSRLSFLASTFYSIEKLREVEPENYEPPPSSKTAIIILEPRVDEGGVSLILRSVLWQEDKKLRNALREAYISTAHLNDGPKTKREARKLIDEKGLKEALLDKRVRVLTLEELRMIAERL